MNIFSFFFKNIQRKWLPVLAVCSGLSSTGHSMVNTHQVFSDPQVAELAKMTREGRLSDIKTLLRNGTKIKTVGLAGMTVSQYALLAPRDLAPEIMDVLLRAGADPVSMLENGNSIPHYAVARDNADPEMVKILLKHGISANWFPPHGVYEHTSLLQKAVMGHNLAIMRLLLDNGSDINYVDPMSGSALHRALSGTDFHMAAYLVEKGIDLTLLNNTDPETPSHITQQTALDAFCTTNGGKRGWKPAAEIVAGWKLLTTALAKRGAQMPCRL